MGSKVFELIEREQKRQDEDIELIASENFVSDNILKAVGSCLTNKYTEGYPDNRYYGGCKIYDELENYCREKWQEVFHTDYHVNVQPPQRILRQFCGLRIRPQARRHRPFHESRQRRSPDPRRPRQSERQALQFHLLRRGRERLHRLRRPA